MALEVQSPSTRALSFSSVPIGQRAIVHIWGRNDMDNTQLLGIHWVVKDPDGLVAQDYSDWSLFGAAPGVEHHFLAGRFDLDKVGTYTINAGLYMNPDTPELVDSYNGDLCSVVEAPPPEVEYELVFEKLYEPEASRYVGKAETCTMYFSSLPEQIPGMSTITETVARVISEQIIAREGTILKLEIFNAKGEWYNSRWKIEATVHSSPFPWAIVVPLIIALLIVIGFAYITHEVKEIDWGKAGIPVVAIIAGIAAATGLGIALTRKRR